MAEEALRAQAGHGRPGELLREAGELRLLKGLCHQVHDQALRDETDDRHEARHLRLTELRLTELCPYGPGCCPSAPRGANACWVEVSNIIRTPFWCLG